jgi:hypothetical protein
MKNKFFIPVAAMLAGIVVWVIFLILHETGIVLNPHSLWQSAISCLIAGGLIVFSGIRCRQVNGPRVGNVVRTILLIILAAITWWRVGIVVAGVLAAGAIVTGVLAMIRASGSD